MYKTSKYNQIVKIDNNTYVVNLLTGAIISILNSDLLHLFKSNRFPVESIPYENYLHENHFIIKEDVDELLQLKFISFELMSKRSLELIIIPTTHCNFNCTYCYEAVSNEKMNDQTQANVIRFVEKNIKSYDALRIGWFGGEPLLEKDVILKMSNRLLKIAQKYGIPFIASMTSNGFFLSDNVLQELLQYHVYSFIITLDGMREQHDKHRHLHNGFGTFDTIVKNLIDIRDNVKSRYFKIRIRINVTKESLLSLEEYVYFLSKEFNSDKRFEFLFFPVANWGGIGIENMLDSLIDCSGALYKALINCKHKLNYNPYYRMLKPSLCYAAKRNSYIVAASGIIKKCTMVMNDALYDIGKLNDDGTMSLENSKLSKWLFTSDVKSPQCAKCKNKPTCILPCPLKHYQKSNLDCEYKSINISDMVHLLVDSNNENVIKLL